MTPFHEIDGVRHGRWGRAGLHPVRDGGRERVLVSCGIASVGEIEPGPRVRRLLGDGCFQLFRHFSEITGPDLHVVDALGEVLLLRMQLGETLELPDGGRVVLARERTGEDDVVVAVEPLDPIDERVGRSRVAHSVVDVHRGVKRSRIVRKVRHQLLDGPRALSRPTELAVEPREGELHLGDSRKFLGQMLDAEHGFLGALLVGDAEQECKPRRPEALVLLASPFVKLPYQVIGLRRFEDGIAFREDGGERERGPRCGLRLGEERLDEHGRDVVAALDVRQKSGQRPREILPRILDPTALDEAIQGVRERDHPGRIHHVGRA